MAKVLLFIALCVLPALVSATRMVKNPLVVQGQVYCDRCRAGFETPKTRNMAGTFRFCHSFMLSMFPVSVFVCYVGGIVRSGFLVCKLVDLWTSLRL